MLSGSVVKKSCLIGSSMHDWVLGTSPKGRPRHVCIKCKAVSNWEDPKPEETVVVYKNGKVLLLRGISNMTRPLSGVSCEEVSLAIILNA